MITRADIEKLATLSRIVIPEKDIPQLTTDMESIVAYISTISEMGSVASGEKPAIRNRFREDDGAHESGLFSDALIAQFPAEVRRFLKVKKIIAQD